MLESQVKHVSQPDSERRWKYHSKKTKTRVFSSIALISATSLALALKREAWIDRTSSNPHTKQHISTQIVNSCFLGLPTVWISGLYSGGMARRGISGADSALGPVWSAPSTHASLHCLGLDIKRDKAAAFTYLRWCPRYYCYCRGVKAFLKWKRCGLRLRPGCRRHVDLFRFDRVRSVLAEALRDWEEDGALPGMTGRGTLARSGAWALGAQKNSTAKA